MRLLVTRPEPDADRTARALRDRGRQALVAPLIHVEPIPDAPVNPDALKQDATSAPPRETPTAGSGSLAPEKEKTEESYTSRLLKAKQKVWEERKQDENKPDEPPGGSK